MSAPQAPGPQLAGAAGSGTVEATHTLTPGMKNSLNKETSTRLPVRDLVLVPGAAGVYDEHDVSFCPDVRAAGHNPHGLTVAQVGAGWRLLAREEIINERHLHGDDRHGLEKWAGFWDATGWSGNSVEFTYRTKKPPGLYTICAANVG